MYSRQYSTQGMRGLAMKKVRIVFPWFKDLFKNISLTRSKVFKMIWSENGKHGAKEFNQQWGGKAI